MKKALMLSATVGVAVVLGASGANAGGGGDLTLANPAPTQYKGKVANTSRKCKKRRNVTVRHDEDEDGYDRGDFKIGSDRTNRRGRYEVNGPQAPPGDQIAAKAKPKDSCPALTVVAEAN